MVSNFPNSNISYFKRFIKRGVELFTRKSIFRILIALVLVLLIAKAGTIFFDNVRIVFLTLERQSIGNLTLAIWQVQAVAVSISIAVVALTVSFIKEKVYGKDIMHFVFIEDRILSLSKIEIIFVLISLIFINYFFAAYEWLFGTLFILFISLMGVLILMYQTFLLLVNFDIIAEKAKKKIIKEFTKKIKGTETQKEES